MSKDKYFRSQQSGLPLRGRIRILDTSCRSTHSHEDFSRKPWYFQSCGETGPLPPNPCNPELCCLLEICIRGAALFDGQKNVQNIFFMTKKINTFCFANKLRGRQCILLGRRYKKAMTICVKHLIFIDRIWCLLLYIYISLSTRLYDYCFVRIS